MKKLLHEKLNKKLNEAYEDYFTIEVEDCSISLLSHQAKALSKEIERCYIPRPRFEDGEPVHDSDMEELFEKGEIGALATCCVYTDGSWEFNPDKYEDEFNPKPWDEQQGRVNDRIKRPAKVLDADGVEIKVGDTVWKTYPSVLKSKTVSKVGCSARREGHAGHEDAPFVDFVEGGWDYARSVTKRESDSLEKLRDDIYEEMCNHEDRMSGVLRNWQCRLTALMERDA